MHTLHLTDIIIIYGGTATGATANLLLRVLLLMVLLVASTGCHVPGHRQQAQEDPGRHHAGPVPCAVHPAAVPHQHHVLG
jgi:hypothetical protein